MGFGWNRTVFGAVLIALGASAAVAGFFLEPLARPQNRAAVAATPARAVAAVQSYFVPDPRSLFGKDRVRVLLVGLDYDYDDKDQETSKQSRSDIIMAVDLDLRGHRVTELSIPRDMEATLPDGTTAKINAAQSQGGIAESQAVISKWLGIAGFDRYVVLRIDTAKDLINALGGIDVDVMNSDALKKTGPNGPIDYDDHWGHLAIHLKPGFQHLDGENAVAYARFRHDWCSDPCRIMRQQQLIHAVVERIERDKFNTLTHVTSLLAVMRNDVDTNITPREQLSTAVAYAHLSPKDITTAQVPYLTTQMLGDYGEALVPDEDEKKKLVASMLFDPQTDAPAQTIGSADAVSSADPSTPAAEPMPADIKIRVENGTHVSGLAARIAADLRRRGFVISDVADADSHDIAATQIHGRNDSAPALEVVRKALGSSLPASATLADAPPTTAPGTVLVILGQDIVSTLPASAASP